MPFGKLGALPVFHARTCLCERAPTLRELKGARFCSLPPAPAPATRRAGSHVMLGVILSCLWPVTMAWHWHTRTHAHTHTHCHMPALAGPVCHPHPSGRLHQRHASPGVFGCRVQGVLRVLAVSHAPVQAPGTCHLSWSAGWVCQCRLKSYSKGVGLGMRTETQAHLVQAHRQPTQNGQDPQVVCACAGWRTPLSNQTNQYHCNL